MNSILSCKNIIHVSNILTLYTNNPKRIISFLTIECPTNTTDFGGSAAFLYIDKIFFTQACTNSVEHQYFSINIKIVHTWLDNFVCTYIV